jgi:hypothetical protein
MQLGINTATQDTIHASGILSSSKFTMDVSGKAFRVLSSSLYANKIGSIVREVSCNASDSHIAAGKPTEPFLIHLPNDLEPWFSVKDTGTGLSHDDISIVYTNVFRSTKDQSNTEIGGFGLGSKTPFCYTDNFNVTSIHNGTKRHYSAIIQPDGQPFTLELACESTNEPNGIEVTVPVQAKDYAAFAKEVQTQLRFLPVKPKVVNGIVEWPNDTIRFDLGSFKIMEGEDYYNKTWIIQGGVGYPLDYELLHSKDEKLNNFMRLLRNSNSVNMYFDIGEIEVTPSREAISYNTATKANIVEKFKIAFEQLYTKFEKDMDALPNDWARAVFVKNSGYLGEHLLEKNNKWKLVAHGRGVAFECEKAMRAEKDIDVNTYDANGTVNGTVKETVKYTKYFLTNYYVRRTNASKVDVKVIEAAENVIVFYDDGCKFVPSRMNLYTTTNNCKMKIYILSANADIVTEAEALEFSKAIGGKELVKVSTLPVPERKPREKRDPSDSDAPAYKIPKLWSIHTDQGYNAYIRGVWDSVTDTAIKNMDGGVYFVITDGSIKGNVNYEAFRLMNMQVYAIREKDLKRVEGNDKWIPYKEYEEKFINEIKEKYKNSLNRFVAKYHSASITNMSIGDESFMENIVKFLPKIDDASLRKYVKKYTLAKKTKKMSTNMINFISGNVFEKEFTKTVEKYTKIRLAHRNVLEKKYKLIQMMTTGYRTIELGQYDHVVLYLNAVHNA